MVQLQEKVISEYPLNTDESVGHIKIIAQYSRALNLLDDYDHQRLSLPDKGSQEVFKISYNEARKAIDELGKQTKLKDSLEEKRTILLKDLLKTFTRLLQEKIFIQLSRKRQLICYIL